LNNCEVTYVGTGEGASRTILKRCVKDRRRTRRVWASATVRWARIRRGRHRACPAIPTSGNLVSHHSSHLAVSSG